MFQSPQTSSTTTSSDVKEQCLDSAEVSEKPVASCNRCKHYKALEDAIESIEGPLFPFYNEMKWIFYGTLWIGAGFLFFTLIFRSQFCDALDRLEKELS